MTTIILHQPTSLDLGAGSGPANPIAAILESAKTFNSTVHTVDRFEAIGTEKSGFEGWKVVLDAPQDYEFYYQDGMPTGEATLQLFDPNGALALEVTTSFYFWDLFTLTEAIFFNGPTLIRGSDGDDAIARGVGDYATLLGGDGDDTLSGGGYSTDIQGGAGDDVIHGLGTYQSVLGGNGNDVIDLQGWGSSADGGGGHDLIVGSDNSDVLKGGGGIDTLLGGGGSDTIFTGIGSDKVDAGAGYDRIIVAAPAGGSYKRMVIRGGSESDSVTFDADAPAVDVYLGMKAAGEVVVLMGVEYLDLGQQGGVVHMGDDGYDVVGGAGDDTLFGGGGADQTNGTGGGRDLVSGGAGDDWLTSGETGSVLGGEGNDQIYIAGSRLVVNGGQGLDVMSFSESGSGGVTVDLTVDGWQDTGRGVFKITGIEGVYAGYGKDILIGDDQNNYLSGGVDDDTVDGGLGDDTIYSSHGRDRLDGGGGNDWIQVSNWLDADTPGGPVVHGGAGDDFVDAYGVNSQVTLRGGAGFDVLVAPQLGGGALLFDAAAGAASTSLSAAVFDGFEAFRIYGSSSADTITTSDAADILAGRSGDDRLVAHAGDDVLRPGSGIDWVDGGDGQDTADYSDTSGALRIDLALGDAQEVRPGEIDTLISIENLTGSGSSDWLAGDDGANTLTGYSGWDTLVGRNGADTLSGNDGSDVLAGGKGSDTFRFELTIYDQYYGWQDRILDLQANDVIDMSGTDADALIEGDQAFELVDAFTGKAGELQLRYLSNLGVTLLEADVTGDGLADRTVRIDGEHVDFDNFVL